MPKQLFTIATYFLKIIKTLKPYKKTIKYISTWYAMHCIHCPPNRDLTFTTPFGITI